ncbi:Glutathione S-transferase Mu 5 [Mizuhopecten yessoensis]|uniref:glutathione transferase n=2 Tax=Mizuhopecten yessoensis TaxID=6573 RepID=A0A210QRD0_MIZYE|nr:Glutathione S-transferase Mu 5 [Mizuhopecten yessoensis]
MPTRLGYWKIRGLAQPVRLLLRHAGEDYEDILYEQGDAPGFDRNAWMSVKESIGLDFPNLPYYMDDDVKITQSNTIIRYIAGKYDLLGKTKEEKVLCDMMLENAMDFRNGTVRLCYNPDYDSIKDAYFDRLFKVILPTFEKFLGKNSWFARGESVTACDFPMYELLDQHTLMKPGCLDDFPNLTAFQKRFEDLPKIKEYLKDPSYIAFPVNNKVAKFR